MTQVPRHPPPTRELWLEWTKVWPIVWRQPDFGPLALRPEAAIVVGAATRVMQEFMVTAWQLALDAQAAGRSFNAAIIVDPARGMSHALPVRSASVFVMPSQLHRKPCSLLTVAGYLLGFRSAVSNASPGQLQGSNLACTL